MIDDNLIKAAAVECLRRKQKTAGDLEVSYGSCYTVDFFGPQKVTGDFMFIDSKGLGYFGYLSLEFVQGNYYGPLKREISILLLNNIHGAIKLDTPMEGKDDLRFRSYHNDHGINPYEQAVGYLIERASPLIEAGWVVGYRYQDKKIRDRFFRRREVQLDYYRFSPLNPDKKRVREILGDTLVEKVRQWSEFLQPSDKLNS